MICLKFGLANDPLGPQMTSRKANKRNFGEILAVSIYHI